MVTFLHLIVHPHPTGKATHFDAETILFDDVVCNKYCMALVHAFYKQSQILTCVCNILHDVFARFSHHQILTFVCVTHDDP